MHTATASQGTQVSVGTATHSCLHLYSPTATLTHREVILRHVVPSELPKRLLVRLHTNARTTGHATPTDCVTQRNPHPAAHTASRHTHASSNYARSVSYGSLSNSCLERKEGTTRTRVQRRRENRHSPHPSHPRPTGTKLSRYATGLRISTRHTSAVAHPNVVTRVGCTGQASAQAQHRHTRALSAEQDPILDLGANSPSAAQAPYRE